MKIDKLENELLSLIILTLRNYINAWNKIPSDIDVNNLNIVRIRYVMEWGRIDDYEDAFIVEISTNTNFYRELLSRSELGFTVDEFKKLFNVQNTNGLLFGKDVVTNQLWYEFPVVWGELNKTFDDDYDYEKGGKYEGNNYTNFVMKYD